MRREIFVGVAMLVALAALPAASAAALPVYEGTTTFPQIEGPADPEEYSWEVGLAEGQALRQLNEQHAEVYYVEDDVAAFTITAKSAHDADGATVPTSLSVSDGNVITLTVHHRDGNPTAGGASFEYPVLPGQAWVVIGGGEIVSDLLGEDLQKVIERIISASPPAQVAGRPDASPRCVVPKLGGGSLAASKRRLRKANCKVGRIHRRGDVRARRGRVVGQNPRPGTQLFRGAAVNLTLSD